MAFADRLYDAMQTTGITAAELSRMTGIGKSSISQYLSGDVIPLKPRVVAIAGALGLDMEYFEKPMPVKRSRKIPKLSVTEAARLLGMSERAVRQGLQDKIFPWGYAVHGEGDKWVYFINAKRFAKIEMTEVEDE